MQNFINATVLIQATNFGITYLFLRNVLFKPIVQRIKQKEDAKIMLQKKLKEQEEHLVLLQNEKAAHLEQFKQNAKKFYTIDVTSELDQHIGQIPTITSYKKNAELTEKMVKQTKELLVKKVPYAY
jgi:hypothetical protein